MQGFVVSVAFADGRKMNVRERLCDAFADLPEGAAHRVLEAGGTPYSVEACLVLEVDGILDDHVGSASDDEGFAICYGEVDDRSGSPAQRLLAAYRAGGIEALGAIHGCYGTLIVDRKTGDTLLFGDGLGQRSLRYGWLDGRLLVATHDILLVAAGLPARPAPAPLASVVRFGWSFGNESLLEGIESVASEELVRVAQDESVTRHGHPAHAQAAAKRAAGVEVAAVRDTIVRELADYVRVNHRPGTPLDVELSAGFDSRTVIGLAHHAARADVRAFTDGPPTSQDARVARRVAAALQVPHRSGGTARNTVDSRLAYIRALALATSGQGTALVAMTSADRTLAESPDSLGGDGGEVFRGYYYPKLGGGEQAAFDAGSLADFVLDKFTIGARLLDADREAQVRALVRSRLQRFASQCRSMADGYDLLYLIERTGTWNQKLRRLTAADRRRNPFYSRAATYAFFTLPGARGRVARIHEAVMRRMAPQTLWIPLNGETIPALMVGGTVARATSRGITLAAKVAWKILDRLGKAGRAGTGHGDLEDVRIRKLVAHIDEDWRDLLGMQAATRALIGDSAMDDLLSAARAGQRWACEVLANVVVAETFLAMARRIAERHSPRAAGSDAPPFGDRNVDAEPGMS